MIFFININQRRQVIMEDAYNDVDELNEMLSDVPTHIDGYIMDVDVRPEGWNKYLILNNLLITIIVKSYIPSVLSLGHLYHADF